MPSTTADFGFIKPNVNDPTDEDLWGGELNQGFDNASAAIKAAILALRHPIGSQYVNFTNPANPSTYLGYGTWVAVEGRVVIGVGTGTDVNGTAKVFAAGSTGGEYTHQLTVNEMPSHTHGGVPNTGNKSTQIGPNENWAAEGFGTKQTLSTGGDAYHNNVQPYRTAYVWERTA